MLAVLFSVHLEYFIIKNVFTWHLPGPTFCTVSRTPLPLFGKYQWPSVSPRAWGQTSQSSDQALGKSEGLPGVGVIILVSITQGALEL